MLVMRSQTRTEAVGSARAAVIEALRRVSAAPLAERPACSAHAARLRAILHDRPGADADTQADRVLLALQAGPATTHELRQFLDVLHPPGRVSTLRERGHAITMTWVLQRSACGRLHRVGLYTLTHEAIGT